MSHEDLAQRLRDEARISLEEALMIEAADRIEELEQFNRRLQNECVEAEGRIEKLLAVLKQISATKVRPGTGAYELKQVAARAMEGKE